MKNFRHLTQYVTPKDIDFIKLHFPKIPIYKWNYKLRTEILDMGGETWKMLLFNNLKKKGEFQHVRSE